MSGIGPLPIAIEEYGESSQVGFPGDLVGYIANFERWGSATPSSPSGMSTAPSGDTLVSVIFGGGSGTTAVTVNGLSSLSAFGSAAYVVLEQTVSAGRTTADVGPLIISSGNYAISGGSIRVPVSSMNAANGYHLVVTPGGSSALSGSYTITNVHSGLRLDTSGSGTAAGTLAVQATADSSSAQHWTLVSEGSNYYEIENNASGLLLRHLRREHHRGRRRVDLDEQRHLGPPLAGDLRGQR